MAKTKTTKKAVSKNVDSKIESAGKVVAAPARAPKPAKAKKKITRNKPATTATTGDNGAMPPPTEAELDTLRGYPMIAASVLAHLLHVDGEFIVVAKQTLAAWQALGTRITLPGLSIEVLAAALAIYDIVAPIEQKLVPYYERARVNRMKSQSDAATELYALARAVKAAGSDELAQTFRVLIEWISKTHKAAKPRTKKVAAKA